MEYKISSLLPITAETDRCPLHDMITYMVNTGHGVTFRIESTKDRRPAILMATKCPDQVVRVFSDNAGIVLEKPDFSAQAPLKRQVFHVARSVARSDTHEVFGVLNPTELSFLSFLGESLSATGAAIEFDFKPTSTQLRAYTNRRMDSGLTAYYQGKFPLCQVAIRIYAANVAEAAHAIAPLVPAGFVLCKTTPEPPQTWPHPSAFAMDEIQYLARAFTELHCAYQECPNFCSLQTVPYVPRSYANPSYYKLGIYKSKPVGNSDGMPTAIIGASGSGKSVLLMNIISQMVQAKTNVLVIAPLKHDFRLLRKVLPEDKLLILNVGDPMSPLFFNPFAVPDGITAQAWQQHVENMLISAGHLDGVLPVVFSNALRTMYSVLSPREHNLIGLTKCVKTFLTRSGYKEKDSLLQASLTRLNVLAGMPCFASDKSAFDITALLKGGEGKVVVLELEGMPTEYMDAIGGMLIASYMEIIKRQPYSEKVTCALVCDEAHRLTASPAITQMLVGGTHEIRAYGGCMIFADQRVELLGHDIFSMGCKHHIILRTACMDDMLAKYLDLPVGAQKAVENLVPGEAILKSDGSMALPIHTSCDTRLMTTAASINGIQLKPHIATPFHHCKCRYTTGVCVQMQDMAAHACEVLAQNMPKGADRAQIDKLVKKTEAGLVAKVMGVPAFSRLPEEARRNLAACAVHLFRREHLLRR